MNRRMRSALQLAIFAGVTGLAPATQAAGETDFQARLEAIQNALVATALAAPSRVRANAWVDESGTLRENTQVTSDVRVRGVRVLSYLEPELPPETRVVVDAVAPLVRPNGCTPAPVRYRRAATLHLALDTGGAGGQPNLADLALHVQQAVFDAFGSAAGWSVQRAVRYDSDYERRLMGNPQEPAYALVLQIAPAPAAAEPVRDIWQALNLRPVQTVRRSRLTLQLVDQPAGRVVWQEAAVIDYPGALGNVTTGPVHLPAPELLRALALQWRERLDQALSCEPLQFRVRGGEGGYYAIDAGSRSGLRVGDQVLLFDAARIPGNVLETASSGLAALAVVERVGADLTVVRRVAGPPLPQPAALVAMPI